MGMNNVMEYVISINNQPWKEIEMKLMGKAALESMSIPI